MGAGKHRALVLIQPGRSLLYGGVLLACLSGLLLAALDEAGQAEDTAWYVLFLALLVVDLVVYFWTVKAYLENTVVYAPVNEVVLCMYDDNCHRRERHHDPAEDGDQGSP